MIELNGATDVQNVSALPSAQVTPVAKTPFLDIVKKLSDTLGIDKRLIPSKIEGIAFGQDVVINGAVKHTLYVSNDNDFLATVADPLKAPSDITRSMIFNPNQFYVFAFSDDELTGYIPQQFQGDLSDN